MKFADITRMNLFGEHGRTRCGRRAQDQALRRLAWLLRGWHGWDGKVKR
jgi:hypothetical protein